MVTYTTTDFSLEGVRPIAGRTLVVHMPDGNGARAACGVITASAAAVTWVDTYPGYTPGLMVKGMLMTAPTSTGIWQMGVFTGLQSGATGGWHVHTGSSCAEAAGVDGDGPPHYGDTRPSGSDPWASSTYTANGNGVAEIDQAMAGFSMHGYWNVR